MNDDNEAPNAERPAVRVPFKRSDRDNIIETIGKLNRYASPKISLDLLGQLNSLSDEDFNERVVSIMVAIDKAMGGDAAVPFVEVEDPYVQVANFERWQRQRSTYYHWCKAEIQDLLQHLQRNPGSVLIPNFAYSCDIRESSGSVYTWRREGK